MTGPSLATTFTRFDYDTDWAGRVVETMAFQAGSSNPTSINDYVHSQETISLGNAVPLYLYSSRASSYVCEYMASGAQATYSEANCRAQVNPRTRFSEKAPLIDTAGTIALRVSETFDGEEISPTQVDGFFGINTADFIYTADDYQIVTTRTEKYTGTATESGGQWSIGGNRAGVVEHSFDSTLRMLERTCVARDDTELIGSSVDPSVASMRGLWLRRDCWPPNEGAEAESILRGGCCWWRCATGEPLLRD